MCSGHFQIAAQLTAQLSHKGNDVIRWPPHARRSPAVAVGFYISMGFKKFFVPTIEYTYPRMEIEAAGSKSYRFVMITDVENAESALIAVLRYATQAVRGIELNASSEGNLI